jgi:Otopetrin
MPRYARVQVILIMSGMRRYPSKREHVSSMPGRGFITFLLVGNVSVWIYRTMQAKELILHDIELIYYGNLAWLLLVNISLPLLLFYRFHSSICLADVWHCAYAPLHEKVPKARATSSGELRGGGSDVGKRNGQFSMRHLHVPSIDHMMRSVSVVNLANSRGFSDHEEFDAVDSDFAYGEFALPI